MSLLEGGRTAPAETRFWVKVDQKSADPCWIWIGARQPDGYGVFTPDGRRGHNKSMRAHRYAYELLVGPIPENLHIDHLCRNRSCVNPAHLEPVEPAENLRRGIGPAVTRARHAAKTHCKHGHEFTVENTYIKPDGHRSCRACKALQNKGRAYDPAAYQRWKAKRTDRRRAQE